MTMRRIDRDAVEAFAAQLGLPVRPGPDGSYAFRFAEDGLLSLVAAGDGERVCMTLERQGPHREAARRAALARAGYGAPHGTLIHACLVGGSLLHAVAFESGGLSLPALDTALQLLLAEARG